MAHFIGWTRGQRNSVSRLGSKKSGLSVVGASWQGSVYVDLWHNARTGQDIATVCLLPWNGAGVARELFQGPISLEEFKELALDKTGKR